jgi:hypothetical protein
MAPATGVPSGRREVASYFFFTQRFVSVPSTNWCAPNTRDGGSPAQLPQFQFGLIMYGSGGRRDDDSPEDYESSPPAYEDIPSTEEVEAKKLASQYTDSLTDEQKDSKMKEGLKMAALVVLGLLGLGVMLIYLDFVLVPLVLSRFLIYIFQPFINVLVGKKVLYQATPQEFYYLFICLLL